MVCVTSVFRCTATVGPVPYWSASRTYRLASNSSCVQRVIAMSANARRHNEGAGLSAVTGKRQGLREQLAQDGRDPRVTPTAQPILQMPQSPTDLSAIHTRA